MAINSCCNTKLCQTNDLADSSLEFCGIDTSAKKQVLFYIIELLLSNTFQGGTYLLSRLLAQLRIDLKQNWNLELDLHTGTAHLAYRLSPSRT